jgi:hypothetical protein
VRRIAKDPVNQIEDRPLIATNDFLKRRLRAGKGLRDERRIR